MPRSLQLLFLFLLQLWVVADAAAQWPSGILAHWRFDEDPGTAYVHDSAGRNHATRPNGLGGIPGQPGLAGKSVSFQGAPYGITAANRLGDFGSGDFTIGAQFKLDGSGGGVLFHHYATYAGGFASVTAMIPPGTTSPQFHLRDTAGNAFQIIGPAIALGVWTHVMMVRGPGWMRMYINGDLVGDVPTPGLGNCTDQVHRPISYIRLGGTFTSHNHWTHFFASELALAGALDDVQVYGRALAASEVQGVSTTLQAGYTNWDHLIAHWPLDEATGTEVADLTGHASGFHTGATSIPEGARGRALRFNGDGQSVILQNGLGNFGEGDFTLSLWLNPDVLQSNDWPVIFGIYSSRASLRQAALFLYLERSTFRLQASLRDAANVSLNVLTAQPLQAGVWQHVAVVRRQSQVQIFIDGVLSNEGATTGMGQVTDEWTQPTAFIRMAGSHSNDLHWVQPWSVDSWYAGVLDDVRVYCRAMSQANLQDLIDEVVPPLPPVVRLLQPADGAYLRNPQVAVQAQIDHPAECQVVSSPVGLAGTAGMNAVVAGTIELPADGVHTISVTATDAFGNVGGTSVNVILDRIAPDVVILAPANGSILGATVAELVVRVVDASPVTLSCAGVSVQTEPGQELWVLPVGIAPGTNQLELLAEDAAGNQTVVPWTLVSDLEGPQLQVMTPASGSLFGAGATTVEVRVAVTDTSPTTVWSEPAGIDISLAPGGGIAVGSFSLSEGSNLIRVFADDGLHPVAVVDLVLVLDTLAPQLDWLLPEEWQFVSGAIDLLVDASDQGSGLREVRFAVNQQELPGLDSPPWQSSFDTRLLADGALVLSATVFDIAGNSANELRNVYVDNTEPALVMVHPEEHATLSGLQMVTVTASDQGAGMARMELEIVGVANSKQSRILGLPLATAVESFAIDTAGLPDGPVVLRLSLVDGVGNERQQDLHYVVDNNAVPVSLLMEPGEGSILAGTVPVAILATGSVDRVEFQVAGMTVASVSGNQLTLQWSTAGLLDGQVELSGLAFAGANLVARTDVRVQVRNLRLAYMEPGALNLNAARKAGGAQVQIGVSAVNLALQLPTLLSGEVVLLVPGGSPVPMVPAGNGIGDRNNDSIPDAEWRAPRTQLAASISAGLANGAITMNGNQGKVALGVMVNGYRVATHNLKLIRPGR